VLSRTARTIVVAIGLVVLLAPTVGATVIISDDFETGDLSKWVVLPADSGSLVFVSGQPHTGTDAAWFGAMGLSDDTILASFATWPGEFYQVDFWLKHGSTDASNDFSVWWDNAPLLTLVNAPAFDYTHYSLVLPAAHPVSTLAFAGRALQDYYYLDDVSVNGISAPEPATLLLFGSGLAALIWIQRRRFEHGRYLRRVRS